jgi:hypothetical protein
LFSKRSQLPIITAPEQKKNWKLRVLPQKIVSAEVKNTIFVEMYGDDALETL